MIQFVTTGGNITSAENRPGVKGHEKLIAKVLIAAEDSAGHGVHLALQIAGGDRPAGGRRRGLCVRGIG